VCEAHAYAAALCQSALIFSEAGDPVSALADTNQALDLIEGSEDPQLLLVAQQNGARYLVEMSQPEAALATLQATESLFRQAADSMMLLRRRWVYAKTAAAFGTREMDLLAEREFRAAADEATSRGLPYEAASILLELAILLAVRRRYMLLPNIVEEIIPLFDALGIGSDATLARMLRSAAQEHHLAAGLLRDVSSRLRRRRR
jgi:hypothetical protein